MALIFYRAEGQTPNIIPQNKDGLTVVTTWVAYEKTVQADSNNRMVPVQQYVTPLLSDIQYATNKNFTKTVLYTQPLLLVRLPVARALRKVQQQLAPYGLSILFYDAYRPYAVTKKMWEIVPDERYAANPAKGSGHNRGIAVDITLADLKTGKPVAMPTPFDNFTEKAHHNYQQSDSAVLANRLLLKNTMEQNGFTALSTEWWHYQYKKSSTAFAILDLPFYLFK
ncbi:D-alanyl-D-alanine dipeptidase [Filimonas zeae]|uniref:D-alanyl-D-alanine dipeptidase n=2 Tax=Filimonas zeae TaxID=1737353 RepID=A0A917MZB9_9BACT|nr:D-alanyl-D-alanine dipeptidase [Filimonas zeae]